MTAWGDIIASTERFPSVGERHGLQLVTDLVRAVDKRGPMLRVEVHTDDLELLMMRFVPVFDGAEWVDALITVLDVPVDDLPYPERWSDFTEQVLEHRRALEDLPVVDEPDP